MNKLLFDAAFGDDNRQVEIFSPFGTGGSYNILMDKFHIGVIVNYYKVGWTVIFNRPEFGSDDMDAITQIVKDHFHLN